MKSSSFRCFHLCKANVFQTGDHSSFTASEEQICVYDQLCQVQWDPSEGPKYCWKMIRKLHVTVMASPQHVCSHQHQKAGFPQGQLATSGRRNPCPAGAMLLQLV